MKRNGRLIPLLLAIAAVCAFFSPAEAFAKNDTDIWKINWKDYPPYNRTPVFMSEPDDVWEGDRLPQSGGSYKTDDEVCFGTDPGCIFVGDSRTVGMSAFVKKNDYVWSAKNGAGYSWMEKTGVPRIEKKIGPTSNVVVMMGFNDIFFPERALQYASYLNEKAAAWSRLGARVYFVSVNPITREAVLDGQITNERIAAWNEDVHSHLSSKVTYIDTFSMVYEMLSAADGIHYADKDYQIIYDLIMDQLNEVADQAKKETENLEDFVPRIMSVVKNAEEGMIQLTLSKPDGIKNVFYEVEVFDPLVSTWAAAARVKTTTVMLTAREDDMKMRARAYKSYRAGISYSKWSKELIVDANGAVKTEGGHWWNRFKNWVEGICSAS